MQRTDFRNEKGQKIFDVTLWSGVDNSIIFNGLEVKENDIFYEIIKPYLPKYAVKELEIYLSWNKLDETIDHGE